MPELPADVAEQVAAWIAAGRVEIIPRGESGIDVFSWRVTRDHRRRGAKAGGEAQQARARAKSEEDLSK